MADQSDDFWPEDLHASIRSPKTVLAEKAVELGLRTKNLLVGQVHSFTCRNNAGKLIWVNTLSIIVPDLNHYTVELITVNHDESRYYPCAVFAQNAKVEYIDKNTGEYLGDNRAFSEEQLEYLLRLAVRSQEISSLLYSLVAQANQAKQENIAMRQEEERRAKAHRFLQQRPSQQAPLEPEADAVPEPNLRSGEHPSPEQESDTPQ